jgi:hypothetical protein
LLLRKRLTTAKRAKIAKLRAAFSPVFLCDSFARLASFAVEIAFRNKNQLEFVARKNPPFATRRTSLEMYLTLRKFDLVLP